jgi:hypothetical protein
MVAGAQSRFTFLAADLLSAAQPSPTPLPKTRVGGFRRHASGRLSRRGRGRSMFTPGSRTCAYKTASGLGNWPNQDPIQELGGINLYEYVANNPVTYKDNYGLYPTIPMPQNPPTAINSPSGNGQGNGAVSFPSSQCTIGTYAPLDDAGDTVITFKMSCPSCGTVNCWKWKVCQAFTEFIFPKAKK